MNTINLLRNNRTVNNTFQKRLSVKKFSDKSIYSGKILDRNSKACHFFGVDSRENVLQKLENHINLALLKSKATGILPSFPKRAFFL